MTDSVPEKLGKYKIIEEVGRGGFAAVYKAVDTTLDRTVALKFLEPRLLREPTFVERFQREAKLIANLKHPNIVFVHEFGWEAGTAYLAMEFLEGQTLKEVILKERALSPERIVNMVGQIASALDYAHGRGLVHRDIKPSNIMVGADDHVTVMDFGIAKAAALTAWTTTGKIFGTPEYMSPEQAEGKVLDARNDVYSLGVVVYEMFTGKVPFSGTTPLSILRGHADKQPPRPSEINPDVSPAVEAVLLKALAKNREARYQSAGALVAVLKQVMSGAVVEEVEALPEPVSRPSLTLQLSVRPQTVDVGGEAKWTVTLRNDADDDLRRVTVRRGRTLLDEPFDLAAGKGQRFAFTTTYKTEGRKTERVTVTGIASTGESVGDEARATVRVTPIPSEPKVSVLPSVEEKSVVDEVVSPVEDRRRPWGLSWMALGLFGLVVVFLLVVAAVGAYLYTQRGEKVAEVPTVVINSPPSGSQVEVGQEVMVQATATDSRGVTRVELWVNGVLHHSDFSPNPQGQSPFISRQSWRAPAAGTYSLMVRAYNAAGGISQPAAITVNVTEAATPGPGEPTAPPTSAPTAATLAPTATPTTVPTSTPTPVPPTSTSLPSTPTDTPMPTDTPTPIPPTATPTSMPTNTHTPTPAPTDTPSPTPAPRPTGRIAFASDRDGDKEIYVMNADGTGTKRLTTSSGDDNRPDWSPDGAKIAFDTVRDGNWEIYVMNADGTGTKRLTDDPGNDFNPDWSPNGAKILFDSNRDGDHEIYVMDVEGNWTTRLTDNTALDVCPDWSPDGTQIAFASDRDGDREIYVMDADGTGTRRLTNHLALDNCPTWSHDGRQIAFRSDRDGDAEIYVMNSDGSNLRQLTRNSAPDWSPVSWSSDGRWVTFLSKRDNNWEVYIMSADGLTQINFTKSPGYDAYPAWLP